MGVRKAAVSVKAVACRAVVSTNAVLAVGQLAESARCTSLGLKLNTLLAATNSQG